MTAFAGRVLDFAASQIGVREQPPGSNRGPVVDEYIRAAGLDPERSSYPWCACFVVWSVRQATMGWAAPVRFRGSASVMGLLERNQELVVEAPEPGVVFLHIRPDGRGHCGFVTGLRDDGDLVTIEGNTDPAGSRTGGQVMAQRRPRSYVQHYLSIA